MQRAVATITVLLSLATSFLGSASASPQEEAVLSEVVGLDGFASAVLRGGTFPAVPAEAADLTGELTACLDDASSRWGWRESNTHDWFFNAGSVPPGLHVSAVLEAAKDASRSVTGAANSCGRRDAVSATTRYAGTTTAGTNIAPAGGCLSRDGRSVVAFGPLDRSLAYACVWFSTATTPWEVVESDIRLNDSTYSWFTDRPVPCSNRFDIESVLTHEWGHTFGLGHVSELEHGELTMSEATSRCSTSARTLGLGDVVGLEALY